MGKITINKLRCEYLENPLGIDVIKPRLNWVLESEMRNQVQIAYQILVATNEKLLNEDKGDLWDTGKVKSDNTNQITYEGTPLTSRLACFWKVKVWDKEDQSSDWSSMASWSMGLLDPSDWKAKWIGEKRQRNLWIKKVLPKIKNHPCPLLRKKFSLNGASKRALVHVSALGHYELYINGQKVGDHVLAPEWTDYNKRVLYQTFDVGDLLQEGDNVIAAIIADGWYKGYMGPMTQIIPMNDIYGSNRRIIAQITIELKDGTTKEIITDATWKMFRDGPIRKSDHFKGEYYDGRKEQEGWKSIDFDDANWEQAIEDPKIDKNLVAQMHEPTKIIKEIKPIEVSEPIPGKFIFDLGQNIAGFCKIKLNDSICEENAKIVLRHGEMLEIDGTLYTGNLRSAKSTDIFIYTGSGEREFQPFFTFHGFQYVEVSGLRAGIKHDLDLLTGLAISTSAPIAGSFESSNPKLNKLFQNIFWTQWDNMVGGVPTDCPQRDERMGWMGDVQNFAQCSMFNLNMAAFYTKYMLDIRDAQTEKGAYPDIIPYSLFIFKRLHFIKYLRFINAPGWADTGVTLPWQAYLNYGDVKILQDQYESAKKFVDFVHLKNPNLIWKKETSLNYGDWLNGDTFKTKTVDYPESGAEVPKDLFATAFFANSARLLSKMAEILGNKEDHQTYAQLSRKIITKFNEEFVDAFGYVKGDTQAGYALALHFKLLPDEMEDKAFQHLLDALERYDTRISTGFFTTPMLMKELVYRGKLNIAYELLMSERFPSWFYMINQGATTMWERWDGFVKGRGFQSEFMNSFNHYSIGAIGEWIYRIILGINLDETKPGYKHVIIKPQPGGNLEWVKGHYESINGKISSEWNLKDGCFNLNVKIPVNTSATIHLPAKDVKKITENGKIIQESNEIELIKHENDTAILRIHSGSYSFQSKIE